jgi:hypothetical protein
MFIILIGVIVALHCKSGIAEFMKPEVARKRWLIYVVLDHQYLPQFLQ